MNTMMYLYINHLATSSGVPAPRLRTNVLVYLEVFTLQVLSGFVPQLQPLRIFLLLLLQLLSLLMTDEGVITDI